MGAPPLDRPLHELACDGQRADDPALSFAWASGEVERRTFGAVRAASRTLAAAFTAAGVGPGARVAIVLPQCPLAAVVHIALSRLDAVSVPLSPLFGPDGLAPRLQASSPSLALVHASRAAAAREAAPEVPVWVAQGAFDERPPAHLRAVAKAPLALPAPGPGDRPLSIIFTSGTTAEPKGAVLPHRVIPGRIPGFLRAHPGFARGAFWSPADWAWIGGLHDALFAPWCLGAEVFAFERAGPFDPATAGRMLRAHDVAHGFLPPTALRMWMRSGAPAPPLATLHTAGEPLPGPVHAWAAKAFATPPREVYGLTECAFLVVNDDAEPTITGTAGPGIALSLDNGGLLRVRRGAPTMMLGYLEAGGAVRLPLDAGGWLATGDLARIDTRGRVTVLGRADDVVKTSGYRVAPREVEQELLRHPAVLECAVVGVPDELRGAALKAFIVLASDAKPDAALTEALRAHVRERLAAHEVPREVVFVAELPKTTTGKVRRAALRGR